MLKINTSRRRGVSLVETIIALLILSIGIMAIAAVPIMTTKLALGAIRNENAISIGMRELDSLEADSRATIPEHDVPTDYSVFELKSSKQDHVGRVTISWPEGSVTLRRSLSDHSSAIRKGR
ncbi:MAG: prepilin-type N-terminal cleavage/methylation domain-containing protein [Synergistaceae bacterium]|nr:prepilin-type N-terminal cleavage/methylation domain-containing protein [Synergistaceae bacterium]